MADQRPARMRRNRGSGEQTAGMHFYVPPAIRTRANDAARSLGITLGRYMEILVARDLLNPDGTPRWAHEGVDLTVTIPMPSTQEVQEDVAA